MQIKYFYFNDNKLEFLHPMPRLINIIKIELCSNKIRTGLENFAIFKQLYSLKLRTNRVDCIKEVGKLANS